MDYSRILEKLKMSSDWEQSLKDGNDLFHFGPKKYEDAVKRYSKTLELLLRHLHNEVTPTLKGKKRNDILQAELKVGQDKAFEKFTFGQVIEVFSQSGLLECVNNNICNFVLLDEKKLRSLNNLRTNVTHHDNTTAANEVNSAREYVTNVLLALKLIDEDPEKPKVVSKETTGPDAKQRRMKNLQDTVRKIRIGLIEKCHFDESFPLEKGIGWFAEVRIVGDVIGAYLDPDETFGVVVNVLCCECPEDEETEAFEHLSKKVYETVMSIAPEAKDGLKIVLFDGSGVFGSSIEGSACAVWSPETKLTYS